MSSDENKSIVVRIFDEIANKKKVDLIDKLFATNYVYHESSGKDICGPGGFKNMISITHSAFPGYHIKAEDMVAEGEKVACRFTANGNHQGELMGIPPTGNTFTITGIVIYRIVGGKVIEQWENFDTLGMLQQIGVLPSSD